MIEFLIAVVFELRLKQLIGKGYIIISLLQQESEEMEIIVRMKGFHFRNHFGAIHPDLRELLGGTLLVQ